MQVLVNNQIISYQVEGSGPVILLLHGWADSKNTFKPLLKYFTKYKVVALDLPGFGGSEVPSTAWGLNDYANCIADFLKKIDVDPSKIDTIIGHSNGGAIAVYGVAESVFSTKKLILLASAGIRTNKTVKKHLLKVIAKTGSAATAVLPSSYKNRLKSGFYNRIGSDLLILPYMQQTFKKIVSQDVQKQASQISVPTLLIYGSKDTQTPPIYGKILSKKIVNSKLHIIQNEGHFLHQQNTAKVAQIIQEFLA